jgi:hypothetical protein
MALLPPDEIPDLWMVSDFEAIRLRRRGEGQEIRFPTSKLKKYVRHFAALAGIEPENIRADKVSVNVQAAGMMAKLHEALKGHGYAGDDLQAYTARLLFCLFADDTGIFPQDSFFRYVEESREDGSDLNMRLAELFQALDEPPETARVDDPKMAHFRYLNGGLFKGRVRRAVFDKKMRKTLLDCLSFDWGQISPAIFGSMFQAAMEGAERRELGAHYTSEENILKLIDPLFMDGLRQEFDQAKKSGYQALAAFHDKLATLKFLDPACGCGNFLITAYRELRRLELDVVRAKRALMSAGAQKKDVPRHLRGVDHALLDIKTELKVAVEQFFGIEILPWPCRLAQTGLWLMDHLMNMEASDELGEYYARLPLTQGAAIVEGNALRIDWNTVVPAAEPSYIMGNPPFVGYSNQSRDQKADMIAVCVDENGKPIRNAGKIDYVAAWYHRAAQYAAGTKIRCAFVSTNSITQGEQAAAVWRPLVEGRGLHIDFAHRAFRWTNEGKGVAQVYCVIVGFSAVHGVEKFIHDGPERTAAKNINPYLVDGPDVWIEARRGPLCDTPEMVRGSDPIDGGNLIIEADEYGDFIAKEPRAARFVRPFMMGEEFITGKKRWCLWLEGAAPDALSQMPLVLGRVGRCKEYRAASKRAATRKGADAPALFSEIRQPDRAFIAVPKVSSDARRYIPIGFLPSTVIAGDKLFTVPGATLWHFGILASSVHNAWARAVCGRLGMGYSYSNTVVYNNFPWPDADEGQKAKIAALAQGVLDARALFPSATLADLYGPLTTPPELLKAHRALDAAVMKLYGFGAGMAEAEVVAGLMERYARLAK